MPIEKSDFDSVTEEDLQELVEAQVPEGLRLEFKVKQYGTSDAEKRELLKDVSAFANTHGGHLIIGVKETGGIAAEIVGVTDTDPDAEIQRIEQIIRSGLDPPISGIRTKAIRLDSGGSAILVRIPRSFYPPHRVSFKGLNRFYARNSAGVHEPGIEELRMLFSQSASVLKNARTFRDERLKLIAQGQSSRPLSTNGRFIIHIVPVAAFSGMFHLDVEVISEKKSYFEPIGSTMGWSPGFNFEGFINHGNNNHGYTQVFRNGTLEAVVAGIVDPNVNEGPWIAGETLERDVFEALSHYLEGLRNVGVPPPLIFLVTLESVKGAVYGVSRNPSDNRQLPKDLLPLPECLLEDYGSDADHHRAVRPAFDALWNAIGFVRAQFFSDDGLWVGSRQQ